MRCSRIEVRFNNVGNEKRVVVKVYAFSHLASG